MLRHNILLVMFHVLIYQEVANGENENALTGMVKKTLVATAHSCMDNVNGTEADLEYLRGDPPYPEKSSCIVTCLLEKISIVKHNKYSKTGFMTAVTPLVMRNIKKMAHMKSVSEKCEKETNHEMPRCQLGNEIITCVYKYAPELHFKAK